MSASKAHFEDFSGACKRSPSEQSSARAWCAGSKTSKLSNRKDQASPTATLSKYSNQDLITQPSGEANSYQQLQYPQWQEAYRLALLELDSEKLKQRVAASEALIFARRRAIEGDALHLEEQHAILDALSGLKVLKRA